MSLELSGRRTPKERKQVRVTNIQEQHFQQHFQQHVQQFNMTLLTVGDNDMDGEIDWLGLND